MCSIPGRKPRYTVAPALAAFVHSVHNRVPAQYQCAGRQFRMDSLMVNLHELQSYIDQLLEVAAFEDYCPNGLQVEGRAEVRRLVAGVTACQALVDAAAARGADALLVHHGYFWKGEAAVITGTKRRRIKSLLDAGISLFGYHLPLDAHPEYGNNAQLAPRLGARVEGRFGPGQLGMHGTLARETDPKAFADQIAAALGRAPLHIASHDRPLRTVAWCTGAAQGFIEAAAALGVDAYVSGEISEQTVHAARELGIDYYAAGHHATERYGAQALGRHLAEHFALEFEFIDIPNPV